MNTVQIGSHLVGPGQPCFVVAEIGINHNGSIENVFKLVDAARIAGAHAVKFQKRTIPVVYSPDVLARPRSIPPTVGILQNAVKRGVLASDAVERLTKSGFVETTNSDLKWALEFTDDEYQRIDRYCREHGMIWFASPWDEESVDFLNELDVPCHKIASATLTDEGILKRVADSKKPVILATGMSTLDEVRRAVSILGTENLILFHTVSTYPPEDIHLNLRVIQTLQREFDVPVGYSGHERFKALDLFASVLAVGLGACAVERHLTLDRRMWGSDQAASIEPDELAITVKQIRQCQEMLGDGVKQMQPGEDKSMANLRRKFFSSDQG